MSYAAHEEIAQLVEWGEGETWEDCFLSTPTDFANQYSVHIKRIGSTIAFTVAGTDVAYYNRVIGLGIEQPATETMLDGIIDFYRQAGSKSITFTLSPLAQPSALPDWLQARGFTASLRWAKVYRGTEPPPAIPTEFRVECIGPENAWAFAQVACINFGIPEEMLPMVGANVGREGWRHYVAWDGDQPVATGALFVKDKMGWLGFGTTLETHRRRGAQGAIMAQRIQDGITLGCAHLISEAVEDTPEQPNSSYHNMMRAGFKLAYLRTDYVLNVADWTEKAA